MNQYTISVFFDWRLSLCNQRRKVCMSSFGRSRINHGLNGFCLSLFAYSFRQRYTLIASLSEIIWAMILPGLF